MKKIFLPTAAILAFGISENAQAMETPNCPFLQPDEVAHYLSGTHNGWTAAFYTEYDANYLNHALAQKGEIIQAPENTPAKHSGEGFRCDYSIQYPGKYAGNWGPYPFVLYQGGAAPVLGRAWIETAIYCVQTVKGAVCSIRESLGQAHKEYIQKLEDLKATVEKAPEKMPLREELIKELTTLIELEKDADALKIVSDAFTHGAKNTITAQYESRLAPLNNLLKRLGAVTDKDYKNAIEVIMNSFLGLNK